MCPLTFQEECKTHYFNAQKVSTVYILIGYVRMDMSGMDILAYSPPLAVAVGHSWAVVAVVAAEVEYSSPRVV